MTANAGDRQVQEEQLDWLHEMHEELRKQTALQERATRAVEHIRVAIVFLVLLVAAVVVGPLLFLP